MKNRCTRLTVFALMLFFILCWLGTLKILRADERVDLPGKVTLVPEFVELGWPRSQDRRDTCSLFAISAVAEFEYARSTSQPPMRFSVEFLTWAANESTGRKQDQAMFYEAVHGLNALGISTEELMPYADMPDAQRKPSPTALVRRN